MFSVDFRRLASGKRNLNVFDDNLPEWTSIIFDWTKNKITDQNLKTHSQTSYAHFMQMWQLWFWADQTTSVPLVLYSRLLNESVASTSLNQIWFVYLRKMEDLSSTIWLDRKIISNYFDYSLVANMLFSEKFEHFLLSSFFQN